VTSERQQSAAAEATPEGSFRDLFQHLPEALVVQDMTGRILDANQAAEELYGIDRGAMPDRDARDITADLDEPTVAARWEVIEQQGSFVGTSIGRHADGSTFPQRVTITRVAQGGRDVLFVLARDLSQEQRLERGLAALTDLGRLQESGHTSEQGLAAAAVDLTMRMFEADRAALAAFSGGQQIEWLAQRHMERFIEATNGLRPFEIPWLERPLRTGIPEVHDRADPARITSAATEIADALGIRGYAIVPLLSGTELTGALGLVWSRQPPSMEDQTELLASVGRLIGMALGNIRLRDSLVRRQSELDESEARYRRLFEEAPQPLLIESWSGCILDANAAAARLYGWERDALIGHQASEVAELDAATVSQLAAELTERRRGVYHGTGRRADGSMFPQEVEIAVVAIGGEDALLVQVRDLTEERRLQGELLQAQKTEALGQLISGVAHELNNPLSAIIAFSQLMQRDDRLPPDVHRDTELLMQEADRTRRIVQNLLDFARQRSPERRPTNLPELIERSLELHAYTIGIGRIEVARRYREPLPAVDADPGQIQQLLLNLLVNAIQAIRGSKPSGTITIEAAVVTDPERDDGPGRLRVSIADDGPGVPVAIRGHLFEPFFTTREVGQGTGLGLSVSYGIVASHGGRLWFEPGVDGGSRFLFELPALPDVARQGPPAARPVGAPSSSGPGATPVADGDDGSPAPRRQLGGVVLAVDDEPAIRTMIERILGRAGHDVTVAASGADALEILRTLTFDVLLIDHRMSGMDGVELYERVVTLRPDLRGRVAMMSGNALDPELHEFAATNGIPLLGKPFDLEQLHQLVGTLLSEAA
jgi:PAS domain S-box-containing protein